MLAMMPVIVVIIHLKCFLLSIFYRWGPRNVIGPGLTYPLFTLPVDGPGCIALINALKN